MGPIRSTTRRARLTIGGVMLGIAALAVALGVAKQYPGPFLFLLFAGIQVGSFLVSRPSYSRVGREPGDRPTRRFRFSIWQIMVVAVFAAACSLVARSNAVAGVLAFVLFGMAIVVVVAIWRGGSTVAQRD